METTREASDESLLAAHRDGDPRAFETLFRRYERPLLRHLARMLGDAAAAEDLVIETFQRLHAHRDDLRPGAAVRPWVYTIGNNLARNRLRRERLARWLPLRAVDRQPIDGDPGGRVGSTDEVHRRIAAALAALPERQREACSLRLLGELSLDEIAAVTGASVGTVKSRLFYGQRRLRELLADFAPGEEGP
jgi:RNA polymerase sigma-70 factor (ECF subfamily)